MIIVTIACEVSEPPDPYTSGAQTSTLHAVNRFFILASSLNVTAIVFCLSELCDAFERQT